MAVDLTAIRTAVKAALVTKLGSEKQTVSAYVLKTPNLPVVWVRPKPDTPILYHQAMANGLEFWTFLVEAICGGASDISAQMNLDAYLSRGGSQSIFDALEASVTLGGVVQNVIVRQCNSYVEYMDASGNVNIGANWLVEIYP